MHWYWLVAIAVFMACLALFIPAYREVIADKRRTALHLDDKEMDNIAMLAAVTLVGIMVVVSLSWPLGVPTLIMVLEGLKRS